MSHTWKETYPDSPHRRDDVNLAGRTGYLQTAYELVTVREERGGGGRERKDGEDKQSQKCKYHGSVGATEAKFS